MRGRPKLPYAARQIHVHIREELLERLDEKAWDPTHKRPTYGARSAVFNALLEGFLDALDAGHTHIPVADIAKELTTRRRY